MLFGCIRIQRTGLGTCTALPSYAHHRITTWHLDLTDRIDDNDAGEISLLFYCRAFITPVHAERNSGIFYRQWMEIVHRHIGHGGKCILE